MSDAIADPSVDKSSTPIAQDEELFKIWVGSLSHNVKEDGLKDFFNSVREEIVSVKLKQQRGKQPGFAYVVLRSDAAVLAALDLNGSLLFERPVSVQRAKSDAEREKDRKERMARRGFNAAAATGEISEVTAKSGLATESDGTGAKPTIRKRYSRRKGKTVRPSDLPVEGDVTEESSVTPKKASKKPGRPFRPRVSRFRRPAGEDPPGERSKTALYVRNIKFTTEDEELKSFFETANFSVVSVEIRRRSTGQSKGYGFVDVGNEKDQERAITEMDGQELQGRKIKVYAKFEAPLDSSTEPTAVEFLKPAEDAAANAGSD